MGAQRKKKSAQQKLTCVDQVSKYASLSCVNTHARVFVRVRKHAWLQHCITEQKKGDIHFAAVTAGLGAVRRGGSHGLMSEGEAGGRLTRRAEVTHNPDDTGGSSRRIRGLLRGRDNVSEKERTRGIGADRPRARP